MADLKYRVDVDTRGAQKALGGLKTALVAIGGALITREVIQITARFEDLQASLNSVTGSLRNGASAFQFVQDFATRTQFGVEDLTKTFIQLKAAGIEPTEKLLTTFADTAAVTTDQLGSLEAITALLSRTTGGGLGLEELERLADRGIPVYRILQQEIGITRQEISKFGQTAEGAKLLVDSLLAGLDKEFGGATQDRLKNLSTVISNFKIAVTNLAFEFGTGLAPAIKDITTGITTFISENDELARTIGSTLGNALIGVKNLVVEMLETMGLLKKGGLQEFSATIVSNLANFLEGFAKSIDFVVNTLTGVINGLQKAVVAISKVPLIGFDAIFLEAGQTVDQFRADLESQVEEINRNLEEFGNTRAGPGLEMQKDKIEAQLRTIDDGSLIVLERLERNFDKATTFTDPFIESLRETAEELRISAEAAATATPIIRDYDDAILRAARALEAQKAQLAEVDRLQRALNFSTMKYTEEAKKRAETAGTEAELSNLTGLQRTLEEIRREEIRLRDETKKRIEEQFKGSDPTELAKALQAIDAQAQATIEARTAAAQAIETNTKRIEEQQKAQREAIENAQKTFGEGWKSAFESYQKNANDAGKAAERIFSKTTRGIEDAIVGFVKTGKFEFKSLIADILEALLRSQIQQVIANTFKMPFGSSGGSVGGGLSNLFAGFFANGGFIPAGQFGVVGENGPELVGGPANVEPILGGVGGGNVTYNISAVDALSFRQLVARDPGFIHSVANKGGRAIPSGR